MGYRKFEELGEMVDFLSDHLVDVKNFDTSGIKTLQELHGEHRAREVSLWYDRRMKKVVRYAGSVEYNICTADGYALYEIKREYPNGKSTNILKRPTETMIRGEGVMETAVRGLEEEMPDLFKMSPKIVLENAIAVPYMHPSSVYWTLMSCSNTYRVKILLPRRPWTDDRILIDNTTKIHSRWLFVR